MSKRKTPKPAPVGSPAHFKRMVALLRAMETGYKPKKDATSRRAFFRALAYLRRCDISITRENGKSRYYLGGVLDQSIGMLPYPGTLTINEVRYFVQCANAYGCFQDSRRRIKGEFAALVGGTT